MSSPVKKSTYKKKVSPKKHTCLSKNIFTKKGGCKPQAPVSTVFVWVFLKKLNFAAYRKAKPLRSKSSSSTANVAKKHPKGQVIKLSKSCHSEAA
jgi:hypothetical protein